MADLLQITGAVLILAAFAGAQFGWMAPSSVANLVLNAVGSAVLATLALITAQWGFLILEGSWALISVWALLCRPRQRQPVAEHDAADPV